MLVWTADAGAGDECARCGGPLDPPRLERRRDLHSGYATRKEAERARTDLLRQLDVGSYVDPSKLTVAGFLLDEWLPARKPRPGSGVRHRGQLGVQTWAEYRGDLARYVIPRLGALRLQELRPGHLNGLYDELETTGGKAGRGLAPKTIKNLCSRGPTGGWSTRPCEAAGLPVIRLHDVLAIPTPPPGWPTPADGTRSR